MSMKSLHQPTRSTAKALIATGGAAPDVSAPIRGSSFAFELGQPARISASHEAGNIIARSEALHGENQYLLRYKANDGRAVEAWWAESALQA